MLRLVEKAPHRNEVYSRDWVRMERASTALRLAALRVMEKATLNVRQEGDEAVIEVRNLFNVLNAYKMFDAISCDMIEARGRVMQSDLDVRVPAAVFIERYTPAAFN